MPMTSTEELSLLLSSLYAAPLEPEMWQVFFDRLCSRIECRTGVFIESRSGVHQVLASGGVDLDPEPLRLYNVHYARHDPFSGPCFEQQRVGVVQGEELVTREELVRTEFYNDLLAPYDLEHIAVVPCLLPADGADVMSFWRGRRQGPISEASSQLLKTVFPHLQTALRLRGMVVGQEMEKTFCEAALDAMSVAAFLVGSDGRVLHMNRRAAAYVGKGDGLGLRSGRLVANNSGEAARLEQLLRGATFDAGEESSPGGAMRVTPAAPGGQLQLTVVPVPEQNTIAGRERYAIVFVSDPSTAARSRTALIRQLYGLSPTECRVIDLLVQGLNVKEVAEQLRITYETARFHLKRILLKTGARRQSELIRLMLTMPGVH
jgi:DNA-binding CsgD family transcriptional regulator